MQSLRGTQLIFGTMDSIAVHGDPRCEAAGIIRTGRSWASGENLLFLFVAPCFQELESPQNPERFGLS